MSLEVFHAIYSTSPHPTHLAIAPSNPSSEEVSSSVSLVPPFRPYLAAFLSTGPAYGVYSLSSYWEQSGRRSNHRRAGFAGPW